MRKLVFGGICLAALLAVGGLSFWAGTRNTSGTPPSNSASAPPKAGGAPAGVAVEAVTVATVKLPNSLAAVGSLRSDETIIVRPEIPGRVAEIRFREGERVTKGSVLVQLDNSVQKADADRARANLTLQKSKFDRAVDLRKQGFISGQSKDEAENLWKVAAADSEITQARLEKMEIKAPFNGTIGLRSVSVGDYVKEGQDIVNLEAIDSLKVDFRVPETFISQVRGGQALQVTLDALGDKAYEGKVYAINPLFDAGGRAIVIRATVPNVDGKLRPGMFARVRLITSEVKDSIMVPEESLFPVGTDKYVYRIVDGRALRTKVEIGQRREAKVEIIDGLSAKDVVVTAGQLKIRDGVVVKVANAPVPAPPPKAEATEKPRS
ncbi:efflux RND transporter periplasmic adaptor subunit [Usitatibacter palustris]|uniref:Multidrug resistance protein MdtA n=1 Tax=Usitatibacter palustris TaxID=2732487 RepID=A0A6M4H9U7_9PROT|nr:efflux RND transporter periplasmic adaptor subunit [Usitatibacter palustris]QJR14827.1 Multidrug resistance protein MdtA [Usitatibacter palustris]